MNGSEVPLAALQAFDPAYTLPTGIKSVRYTIDPKTGHGYHFQHDGIRNIRAEHPCESLNRYISQVQSILEIAKNIAAESKEIDDAIEVATKSYQDKRASEYPSTDELVVALWEMLVEGRDTDKIMDIQNRRLHIKHKYPADRVDSGNRK